MASSSGGSSAGVGVDGLSGERSETAGVDGSGDGSTEGTDSIGGGNPTGGQPVIDGRRPGGGSLPAFAPEDQDGDGLAAFPSELRVSPGDTSSRSTAGDSSTSTDQQGGSSDQGGSPAGAGTNPGDGGPTAPTAQDDTPLFPSEIAPPTQLRVDNDQPQREPVRSVPEPASIALGATAAAGFALRARRRRRLA